MITDSFLDSCFTIILNKTSKIKKTKALYRDIVEVLEFSESRETYEIPLNVKSKLDCLRKIANMLLEDREIENILDSISFSEKFMEHRDYLDLKVNGNYDKYNNVELISNCQLVESCYESFLIDQYYKCMSSKKPVFRDHC